jgi:MOSC domain-containing protein YiiM
MQLASLNVGRPREVTWRGRTVTTGIYKNPVEGPVMLRTLNLDGDGQADLSVHGGKHKAVYCYPLEHYAYWQRELPGTDLRMGMFGENFTTEGLTEDDTWIGDQFTVGSATVVVTQPRLPCYKLGIRFQSDQMVKRFQASGRTGFYVAVAREGSVRAGQEISRVGRDPDGIPVSAITRLYVAKTYTVEDARIVDRALRIAALPDAWKDHLRERLAK